MKRRFSLRIRLMLLMICITTIPVITMTWIAVNNTRNSVESEIIDANISRMQWADQYLNELLEQLNVLFYTLQIDEQLMNHLTNEDRPAAEQFTTQNYVSHTLNATFYAYSRKIDELTLYMNEKETAITVNFTNSGLFHSLDIGSGNWSRIKREPVNIYFKQSPNGTYAYHSINRFLDRKMLGGISTRIKSSVWEEVSLILNSEEDSLVFLMNDEGELLSGSTHNTESKEINAQLKKINKQGFELEFERSDHYFYFLKRVNKGELIVMKAIPMSTVDKSANTTIMAGLLTGVIFTILSIMLSILFSLRISRPIVSLARTMRRTEIQTFEEKSVQHFDEIGLLEHGYNSMMKRIRELIENEYQKEIDVKDAQLKALQAQINPHFLNNTLVLVGGIALSKNAPQIYKITQVMGNLLRYSISNEGDLVTLEKEILHMNNYLFIQEQRFRGRCKVKVSVNEDVKKVLLPKFTLQPIVENAFEHGLQKKEGNWSLDIRVTCVGRRIGIIVKDNGVGIPNTRLSEIRRRLSKDTLYIGRSTPVSPKSGRGIGMENVNARLKLRFGEQSRIHFFSRSGIGTLIYISIPFNQWEEHSDV